MKPVVIGISGTTGCGKSTVASELAHRLGIVRTVSTDMVREVMRSTLPFTVQPLLHKSSFELRDVDEFYEQARIISVGVDGLLKRAKHESLSMIIEGVHLIPGEYENMLDYHYMLHMKDAELHREYLKTRSEETKGTRPAKRYLDNFDRIRKIQNSLLLDGVARRNIKIIDNTNIDGTVESIVEDINGSN